MAKKTINFRAPPPKEVTKQIDDWVKGKSTDKTEDIPKVVTDSVKKENPVMKFTLHISRSTHKKFKQKCVLESITMGDAVEKMIERHLKK